LAAAVVFALVVASPRSAQAETQFEECRKRGLTKIAVQGDVEGRFLSALDEACKDLVGEDIDAGVELQVVAEDGGVALRAVLPDGRTATRHLRSAAQLGLALNALTAKPPERRPALDRPNPSTDPFPAQNVAKDGIRHDAPNAEHRFSLEVGAGASLHVAGAPTTITPSVAAYAGVLAGHWLGTLTVRWDPIQVPTGAASTSAEMDSAGAGIAVLRSVSALPVRVDLGLEALFLLETQSVEGDNGEHAATSADFRLGIATRALFGHSNPRWSVSAGVNGSPARLRRDVRLDPLLPPLPKWEAGIGLGASWSQL
jgi:hypothetical protein